MVDLIQVESTQRDTCLGGCFVCPISLALRVRELRRVESVLREAYPSMSPAPDHARTSDARACTYRECRVQTLKKEEEGGEGVWLCGCFLVSVNGPHCCPPFFVLITQATPSSVFFLSEYVVVQSQPFACESKEDGTPFPFGRTSPPKNHVDPGNACSKEQSWERGCLALFG